MTTSDEKILFHVGYEWWMFRSTHDLLNALPEKDDPVRNALVESLLIHGRVLIDFFYKRKNKNGIDIPEKKGDWIVDMLNHRLTREDISSDLESWYEDANKRVAHLTESRAVSLKFINVQPILNLLNKRIECMKTAFGNNMPNNWTGNLSTTSTLLGPLCHKSYDEKQEPVRLGPTGPAGI